jgi:branched-chain amino acid transport system substrate-binding protein
MFDKRARTALALLLVAAMIAVFALAGCTTSTDSTDEDDGDEAMETVKIGVHTSLTGQLADYGAAAVGGLKIAAEDSKGFEVDGTKYEVELVIKDDKGEEGEAVVVAQELVDEGVVGVVGALTSGATFAALPIYEEAGIPVISGSATNPDLTIGDVDYTNFFRTCLRDDLQGKALGEWALEMDAKKIAIMDDRGDYAVGLADITQAAVEEGGAEVQREQGESEATDYSAQVNNIKAFGPDAVIFTGYHQDAGLLFKQLNEAGVETIQMGGDGIKSDEIADEAGGAENVDGSYATFGGFAQEAMPGFEDFAATFEENEGVAAGPYAENNHDALLALVAAMVETGSMDGADLIAALPGIEITGAIQGDITFDEGGDITLPGEEASPALIPRFEFKDGTWMYISMDAE